MIAKIPVGSWIQSGVTYLTTHWEGPFRILSEGLGQTLETVIHFLTSFPPIALISLWVGLIFLWNRQWKNMLGSFLGLLFIDNLGYWQEALETISLVVFSTFISVSLGIPLGILCARRRWLYRWVQPTLDLMQTIPTFVFLIPTLMLFGLGLAPGIISTVIFAMPAPIRLTYLGITSVPTSLLEVSDAFGATPWQRLLQVELPQARTSILSGISQCIMLSLSMVVIAALVGADGLGKPVIQALNTVNIAKGFESGVAIVIVAIFLDRILGTSKLARGASHG